MRRLLRLGILIALWAMPVALLTVGFPGAQEAERDSVAGASPDTVLAGSREDQRRTAVNVVIDRSEAPTVSAPASGVITALGSDGPVDAGDAIVGINGVPVLAYRGPPLFRDLAPGDEGDDVTGVSSFHAGLGLLDSSELGETYDSGIADAVRDLQQDRLGVRPDGRFRLAYVARIVEDFTTVETYEVSLGDSVSPGTPVAVGARQPRGISLTPLVSDQGSQLPDYEGRPLQITFGELVIPLSSPRPRGQALLRAVRALDAATRDGRIEVGSEETGTAGQLLGGVVSLRVPVRRATVPATAVRVDPDGSFCVLLPGGPATGTADGDPTPYPLRIAEPGIEPATVLLEPRLAGTEVIRDVSAAPGDDCGA